MIWIEVPYRPTEPAQTAAQKRGADAMRINARKKKRAVQPDGQFASQQTGEVFVDCGAAPFNFDEKNRPKLFCTDDHHAPGPKSGFIGGKICRVALEEAGQKVGESHNCDSGCEQTCDS